MSDAPGAWDVVSSEGAKTYRVELSADGREISSNDNASYWQGYLGYPAIAVLMSRGTLRASAAAMRALAGIPWKELNRRFKNDYARTTAEVARIVKNVAATSRRSVPKLPRFSTRWPHRAPERGARRRPRGAAKALTGIAFT